MGRKPTNQEIADALGLAERKTVTDLRRKGMPQSIDGAKAWYAAHGGAPAEASGDEDEGAGAYQRKLVAEARCKEADAQRKELDYRERVGELVERDAAHRTLRQMLTRVKARLQSIPDELAATVEPGIRSQVAADHRERIRLILLELAEMGREFDE